MTKTLESAQVDPKTLAVGDRINAGGSRNNVRVVGGPVEWGTGTVSVMVSRKGKWSQVFYRPEATATLLPSEA